MRSLETTLPFFTTICGGFSMIRRHPILGLILTTWAVASLPGAAALADVPFDAEAEGLCAAVEPKVIEWRRHFHQYPELSNREFETAKTIAEHLEGLGLAVETGVAHTGVVALLEGAKPGPVVLLRADIDALPVTERNDLPYRSEAVGTYNGEEVGVRLRPRHPHRRATGRGRGPGRDA